MERGVGVEQFDLTITDIGKLSMALVDAATIVVGTPTILAGPNPYAAYATLLANAFRPKTKFPLPLSVRMDGKGSDFLGDHQSLERGE